MAAYRSPAAYHSIAAYQSRRISQYRRISQVTTGWEQLGWLRTWTVDLDLPALLIRNRQKTREGENGHPIRITVFIRPNLRAKGRTLKKTKKRYTMNMYEFSLYTAEIGIHDGGYFVLYTTTFLDTSSVGLY